MVTLAPFVKPKPGGHLLCVPVLVGIVCGFGRIWYDSSKNGFDFRIMHCGKQMCTQIEERHCNLFYMNSVFFKEDVNHFNCGELCGMI